MTENEIREMVKDVLLNDALYEGKHPLTHCINSEKDGCSECGKCWSKYKIGDEVHSDWEYRKVEKYCVIKLEHDYLITLKNDMNGYEYCFEGTEEECKHWVEENIKDTWLDKYLRGVQNRSLYGDRDFYEGIKAVCKKILEEVDSHKWDYEDAWDRSFEVIDVSSIHNIIKDLGVEL